SDENDAGNITNNNFSNTYAVSGNGRTVITAGPTDHPPILYLYDLNSGFFVDTGMSANTGRLEQQAALPLSNASVEGNFFLGNFTPAATVNPIIGEGSLSGTGNTVFTEDGTTGFALMASDIIFNDTYSVAANGRSQVGDGSIAYVVNPSKIYSIRAKPGKT